MASPRTNLAAPSIEPKKALSSSSSLRRALAEASSMRPAERSASIAICLPGMASSEKRAATSAMRPEPLVMTTKLTITRMAKTMIPMTKLPCMMKPPKASITPPAASGPSWPCARISRVEARLSERRSMVAIRSTVGKAEKSSGFSMKRAVSSTSTENMIESASNRSSRIGGSGRMRTTRMAMTPKAMSTSLWRSALPIAGSTCMVVVLSCSAMVSLLPLSPISSMRRGPWPRGRVPARAPRRRRTA